MQTCTGTNEQMTPLTLESLSQAYDLAVKAAQKDACRFLECLFPDAEIDPEAEYLLLIDWHLTAKQVGIPFGPWASGNDLDREAKVFGRLTIQYSKYVPRGMIYLIKNRLGHQWLES